MPFGVRDHPKARRKQLSIWEVNTVEQLCHKNCKVKIGDLMVGGVKGLNGLFVGNVDNAVSIVTCRFSENRPNRRPRYAFHL